MAAKRKSGSKKSSRKGYTKSDLNKKSMEQLKSAARRYGITSDKIKKWGLTKSQIVLILVAASNGWISVSKTKDGKKRISSTMVKKALKMKSKRSSAKRKSGRKGKKPGRKPAKRSSTGRRKSGTKRKGKKPTKKTTSAKKRTSGKKATLKKPKNGRKQKLTHKTKPQLKAVAKRKGLSTAGTRQKLMKRISTSEKKGKRKGRGKK